MTALDLIDDTFCCGQWACPDIPLNCDVALPFARRIDRMGFAAVTVMDAVLFEQLAGAGRDNPWVRMSRLAQALRSTPANVWIRGGCGFGIQPLDTSAMERFLEDLATAGVGRVSIHEPLNNVSGLGPVVRKAEALDLEVVAGLTYSSTKSCTDTYYVDRVEQVLSSGCERVCLVDTPGSLSPDRARTLIPAMQTALGSGALELWLSASSGLAERVGVEAVTEAGVDTLHAVSAPLGGSGTLPEHDYFAANLARLGHPPRVAVAELAAYADYLGSLADLEGWDVPEHVLHDPALVVDEIRAETVDAMLGDDGDARRVDLLSEIRAVRSDFGAPPMVPPIAAAIIRQALAHLAETERYRELQPALLVLARGGYGPTPGQCASRIRDRADDLKKNGSVASPVEHDDAGQASPAAFWPVQFCPHAPVTPVEVPAPDQLLDADTPLNLLVSSLKGCGEMRTLRVRKGEFVCDLAG